jgi:hypothetical protein
MTTTTAQDIAAAAPNVTIPDAYASSMETIAPGITDLLAQNQGVNQNWYDALSQLIPALSCTPLQSQLLMQEVTNAQAGLPPVDPALYASNSPVTLTSQGNGLMWMGVLLLVGVMALGG